MYSATPGIPPWQSSSGHYSSQPQNAYTSVPARQTFASSTQQQPPPPTYNPLPFGAQVHPPPPPPPQIAAPPAQNKTQWSPAIRDYVGRSFALENAIKEVSKTELEARLKSLITEMAGSHRLDTIDWKSFPLPQQLIVEERKRAAFTPLTVSPVSFPNGAAFPSTNGHSSAITSKKRKSNDLSDEPDQATAQPPWRYGNKPALGLADRVTFAPTDKRQKVDETKATSKSNLEARRRRFDIGRSGHSSPSTPHTPHGNSPEPEIVGPVVGRSQKLEKNYFRLTSAPNPDDVRPLPILKQTLELLKKKWRAESNYVYICDQFKSLRQDLTVQHIKDDFTIMVYEIHARIALEKGDLGEYNQCQTQLRALYKQGLGGHPVEFKAYRILYFIHTCNRTDMNDVLSELTPADKQEDAIKHALQVRSALALGNYHKFFKLYLKVPNMGAYLMDMFVERERLAALAQICKGYSRTEIKLRFVTDELAFDTDEEAAHFVLQHGGDNAAEALLEKDGDVRLVTQKLFWAIEAARAGAQVVDIKGQI